MERRTKGIAIFDEKGSFIEFYPGFRYFDTVFEGMKIRCMLYQVFERMNAQSLEFYYENNEQEDSLYMVVVYNCGHEKLNNL